MSETSFATALDSLGELLSADPGRDAIHLATHAAVAAEKLVPGQHIGLIDGKASAKAPELIGIVDPFLNGMIFPDQMFWMLLYPRTITSLRHVWEHPAFGSAEVMAPKAGISDAEAWIRRYCADIGCTFDEMIEHTQTWVHSKDRWGEYWVDGGRWEGVSLSPEYWQHYEAYSGQSVPEDKQHSFFSCAC